MRAKWDESIRGQVQTVVMTSHKESIERLFEGNRREGKCTEKSMKTPLYSAHKNVSVWGEKRLLYQCLCVLEIKKR